MSPFVAWHSSPYRFRKFNTSREGAHFGTKEQADNLRKPGKLSARAYLLNIKNPLRVRDLGTWTVDGIAYALHMADITSSAENDAIYAERNWSDERGYAKIKEILGEKGYDGFVYENELEGEGDSFVAFYSHQIRKYELHHPRTAVGESGLEDGRYRSLSRRRCQMRVS